MSKNRECDGCTKCCEGWLTGEAFGHKFFRGRPCFFLAKNCTIYDSRPDHPCRSYECGWKTEEFFPMWLKPDLVNVIINKVVHDDIVYYCLIEAGSKLESSVLSYMIQWALHTNNNLLYYIDGGINRIGSKEFLNLELR